MKKVTIRSAEVDSQAPPAFAITLLRPLQDVHFEPTEGNNFAQILSYSTGINKGSYVY